MKRGRISRWLTALGALFGAAMIPTLLIAIVRGGLSSRSFVIALAQGLTFATCVGGLCYFAFSMIGARFNSMSRAVRWTTVISVLFLCSLCGTALALLIFQITAGWRITFGAYLRSFQIAFLISLIIGITSYLVESLRYRVIDAERAAEEERAKAERALRLATEAQLSSLESRIHPHFLFNTLNSISALIREDPATAERLVERLSALLRFSLDVNRGLVDLATELKIVTDYLEIERARFGSRLRYQVNCTPGLQKVQVPAMCVQILVENAVKHSIATRREGGEIRVDAVRGDGSVRLEVSDDGRGFEPEVLPEGHGLDTLNARLRALFEGRGTLSFSRHPGGMRVTVDVPE